MALFGFEGYEKRLELRFSGEDPSTGVGLRQLNMKTLEEILSEVQCTIVSALGNRHVDSYVLSESSLFVYPNKIIIKTCGTTKLLKSVRPFLHHASEFGLTVTQCVYTRGSFIFPNSQPYPYTSFEEEVKCLNKDLPSHLCYKKASVMHTSWHVFSASVAESHVPCHAPDQFFTIEVCMTELDRLLAGKFYRRPDGHNSGDISGKEMTESSGIQYLNLNAVICDFGFDPCGYSMNGIDGYNYSTIHVTPEDGFSYASFECVGSVYDDVGLIMEKLVGIFGPGKMSVAVTSSSDFVWRRVGGAVEKLGMECESVASDEFPAVGSVVFQAFTSCRNY